ncbi:hypothetical protein MUN46_006885 [Mesosutterella sp. AGMB02718]|uniref:DUF2267 domain-containing protein n=1 Tax=Mesosutterella faecium TaxID=2925194 RepID=A0ABT7IMP4_9BURK|nr:hypothetical protein [Mesosutterella sp. AGMB02718]MDL2059651.1 hypothetical protein [Mesosutterella sp. AGMB02718]
MSAGHSKPICAGYSPSCPSRCRLDLSSKRDLGPQLTDPRVIEEIFRAAVAKTASRMRACQEGRMTAQELREADGRLIDWLAATLSGENENFGTTEGWNPEGLARFLSSEIPGALSHALGREPESQEEVIRAAAELMTADIWSSLRAGEAALEEAALRWSSLLTGAPAEFA